MKWREHGSRLAYDIAVYRWATLRFEKHNSLIWESRLTIYLQNPREMYILPITNANHSHSRAFYPVSRVPLALMNFFNLASKTLIFFGLLLLSTSLLMPVVYAQTGAGPEDLDESSQGQRDNEARDEPVEIDRLVIQGTKQDVTLQEADVSVELFTEERLANENLFDLDDVFQRTPNLQSNGATSDITIRGISRFGVGGAGRGVTSNVYFDGAPLSTTALALGLDSLWDIGQVEVLKGPQSIVQGRNALAGSVVVTSNKPTFYFENKSRIRLAEDNTRQFSTMLSGPINNSIAFRLAADKQVSDGFVTNFFTGEDQNDFDALLVRGKLLIEPENLDALSAEFTLEHTTNEGGGTTNFVRAPVPANDPDFENFDFNDYATFNSPIESDLDSTRFISNIRYQLNPSYALRSITTYENTERDSAFGEFDNPGQFVSDSIDTGDFETFSSELRLEFDFDRWSGTVGAYYFEEDTFTTNQFSQPLGPIVAPFPLDPVNSVVVGSNEVELNTENYAVYVSANFEFNPRWELDLAVRYDYEEFATTGVVSGPPSVTPDNCTLTAPGFLVGFPDLPFVVLPCIEAVNLVLTPGAPNPIQEDDFNAFLPRATLTHNINNDISVFVSVERGYRAGGTFLQPTIDGQVVGTFDPEFSVNYEAGFRSVLLEGDLIFNGNFFYNVLEDLQVVIPGPSGTFNDSETINAGESSIYGAEFLIDYRPTNEINLYSSIGLLNAEFDDFPFALPGTAFENLNGNRIPNSPELSFTLGANYRSERGFFANASWSYTGEQQSNIFDFDEDEVGPGLTGETDARNVVNLRVGYERERFSVYAYVNNLLNDEDAISRIFAEVNRTTGQINFFANPSQTFADPRTFGVGLDFRF